MYDLLFTLAESDLAKQNASDTEGLYITNEPQRDGYGLFYLVNTLQGRSRKADNITHINAVISDFDNPEEYENVEPYIQKVLQEVQQLVPLKPTSIIRTAKGLQYRWDFTTPIPASPEMRDLYRHVPKFLGSDSSCSDISRVQRQPNSNHWKRGYPIHVTQLSLNENKYSLDQIKKAFAYHPEITIPKEKVDIDDKSVWVQYNRDPSFSFDALLTKYEWKRVRNGYYTRPGKDQGVSAHVIDDEIFYCFTSSTKLEAMTSYSKSFLLCALEFDGDKSKCVSYLRTIYHTYQPTEPQTERKETYHTEPIPEYLLRGPIGTIYKCWGKSENDFSALIASITIAGIACKDIHFVARGGYIKPYLYTMFAGPPSSGKSTYLSYITEMANHVEVQTASSPESGQSFVRVACGFKEIPNPQGPDAKPKTVRVTTPNQQTLFSIDEFASCIKAGSAGSSILMESMRSGHNARSLGSTSLSNTRDMETAMNIRVENPFISIITGITSSQLEDLIKNSEFESGGLASRFLYTQTFREDISTIELLENNSKYRVDVDTMKEVVENIRAVVHEAKSTIPYQIGNILGEEEAVLNDSLYSKMPSEVFNEENNAFNRVMTNAWAVGWIYALSEGRARMTTDDVRAGWWVVGQSMRVYLSHARNAEMQVVGNTRDSDAVAIRTLLVDAVDKISMGTGVNVSLRDICKDSRYFRRLKKFTAEQLREHLKSLVSSGDLIEHKEEIRGRERVKFSMGTE